MEVQQCMKLTVTNCSIGLISLRPVLNMSVHYVWLIWCVKQLTIQSGIMFSDNFLQQADLDDLVTLAYVKHPIPFRTGP